MSSWARRKERIATDPEFAERIRRQQRESAQRRRDAVPSRRCPSLCPFGDDKGLVRCTLAREHTLPHRNDARGKVWSDPKRGRHAPGY